MCVGDVGKDVVFSHCPFYCSFPNSYKLIKHQVMVYSIVVKVI